MANLKEVRTRMASVKSTQQITKAMKMVSAAKLRRAQDKIIKMRPYADKLNEIMSGLGDNIEGSTAATYFEARKEQRTLFVLITSDKGLCGAFNSSLVKKFKAHVKEHYPNQAETIDIYSIGKRGKEAMSKYPYEVVSKHDGFFQNFSWDDSEAMANEILGAYNKGKYDKVFLVYNEFKNAATYFNRVNQFLPIVQEQVMAEEPQDDTYYLFEPSRVEILDDLVPRSLKITFYKALLDSNAAEHGARMTAMDNATENAQDLLRSLSIEYNKARQAAITTEILEIVGGAEALENG